MSVDLTSAGSDLLSASPEASRSTTSPAQPVVEKVILQPPPEPAPEPVPEVVVDGVQVSFLSDFVRVHLPRGQSKDIAYKPFLREMLQYYNTLTENDPDVTTKDILLPRNTYLVQEVKDTIHVCQYFEESVKSSSYRGDPALPRVVPNLVLTTVLKKADTSRPNNHRWIQTYYFCTSLTFDQFEKRVVLFPDRAQKTCIFPYPNMYSDGKLCFGDNFIPKDFENYDFRGLSRFYDVLWDAPFNNDLSVRAAPDYSAEDWMRILAEHAAQKKPFPYSLIGI